MAALVRHFGDDEDAGQPCGQCDACDPAGAVLRSFRHATPAERDLVQRIIEELRPLDYLAAGTLQRRLDPEGRLTRDQFESLLDAMTRARLIDIEDAEFEKNGELIRFRKLRLAERGFEVRRTTPLPLLISEGVVAEFAGKAPSRRIAKKPSKTEPKEKAAPLTPAAEQLAAQLKEWRATESKRLGVPAYVVLHDRTVQAIAAAIPTTPNQLLAVDGMGPAKLDKFGEAILALCRAS
jgi:ATP-dependent DNA helicase RecQ